MKIIHQPYKTFNKEEKKWEWRIEKYISRIKIYYFDTEKGARELYKKLRGRKEEDEKRT